jgi:hypothetical protein
MFRERLVSVVSCPLAFLIALATPASGLINLEWRPDTQTVPVGATVDIGLYAVSDDPEMDQYILAMDVIVNWDADSLELTGVDDTGPYTWLFSGFPVGDVDGLNDTFADGDALYTALGQLGAGAWATPEGLLVTTFQFTALAETPGTTLTIPEDAGSYTHTAIWGSPGQDVHGTLGSASVTVLCGTADSDADGDVDLADFAAFQICFTGTPGVAETFCECVFDSDDDHDVDLTDFGEFAANFSGPAP